jgi:hypothetical protein
MRIETGSGVSASFQVAYDLILHIRAIRPETSGLQSILRQPISPIQLKDVPEEVIALAKSSG